jgi:hypothetical protein
VSTIIGLLVFGSNLVTFIYKLTFVLSGYIIPLGLDVFNKLQIFECFIEQLKTRQI